MNPKQARIARRLREYSQDRVARKIGVTQGAISSYERGRHNLSPERLKKLERLLKLPPDSDDGEA